jgi:hypothetical protein
VIRSQIKLKRNPVYTFISTKFKASERFTEYDDVAPLVRTMGSQSFRGRRGSVEDKSVLSCRAKSLCTTRERVITSYGLWTLQSLYCL